MAGPTLPDRIRRARYYAMMRAPYLSAALMALRPGGPADIGTVAVDRWGRLYWSPRWVDKQPVPRLAAALVHECGHVVRGHADRCGGRDPELWNVAADAEINDSTLLGPRGPLPLGDQYIYPEKLGAPRGLTAEMYYDRLRQQARQVRAQAHDCGSCAGGDARPYEAPAPQAGGPPGLSDIERRAVARQTARDIQRAASRAPGSVPADWMRWADAELGPPRVRWQALLRGMVSRAVRQARGRADYTYTQPARRQVPGIVMPGMAAPVVHVAVVIDTSGSMTDADLRAALSEIEGIVQAAGAPARVYACDTRAHDAGHAASGRDVRARLRGGGGTDMAAGIAAALEASPRPACIIVITDGYTPWPQRPPGVPVIAAIVPGGTTDHAPAWLRTVGIEP